MASNFFFLEHCQYHCPVYEALLQTHLFQCHSILHEQCYTRVEIAHILFKHEILLGLG